MTKEEIIGKILDASITGKHSDAVKTLDEFGISILKEAEKYWEGDWEQNLVVLDSDRNYSTVELFYEKIQP